MHEGNAEEVDDREAETEKVPCCCFSIAICCFASIQKGFQGSALESMRPVSDEQYRHSSQGSIQHAAMNQATEKRREEEQEEEEEDEDDDDDDDDDDEKED